MPFTMPNFPILSFKQANPLLAGIKYGAGIGQDLLNSLRTNLLNQELQAKMPYVGPKEREALKHAQLMNTYQGIVNKFTPEDYQTTFASRGASTALNQEQARKLEMMRKNPLLMSPDTAGLAAMQLAGLINKNFQPVEHGNIPVVNQQVQSAPMQVPQIQRPEELISSNMNAPQYGNRSTIESSILNELKQNKNISPMQQVPLSENLSPMKPAIPQQQASNGLDVQGMVNAIIQSPLSKLRERQARTASMEASVKSKAYSSMPWMEKEYTLAQARAMNYDQSEASKLLNEGFTLKDLAKAHGFKDDPKTWPIPVSAPTIASLTRMQQSNVATAGVKSIEPFITEGLAPYQKTWGGVSLSQLYDISKGKNKDRQAKALAAGTLSLELNLLRARQAGLPMGITALHEALETSQTKLARTPELLKDPEVFKLAQKYINRELEKLNVAENKALFHINEHMNEVEDRQAERENKYDMSGYSDEQLAAMTGEPL